LAGVGVARLRWAGGGIFVGFGWGAAAGARGGGRSEGRRWEVGLSARLWRLRRRVG
jgi:hypothetical protein